MWIEAEKAEALGSLPTPGETNERKGARGASRMEGFLGEKNSKKAIHWRNHFGRPAETFLVCQIGSSGRNE